MDTGTKQRLIGAAVLIAIAVIFLPMLVQGPAPDSGVSDVPLQMPDAPKDSEFVTRDLPLAGPGETPAGGAVGMQGERLPTVDTGSASEAVGIGDDAGGAMLPASMAAGDYAVHFGAYATPAAADTIVRQLRQSQLPGYREQTTVAGKPAWRVRIGPYATRADAEASRLRAAHVRDDVGARVVVLDADAAAPSTPAAAAPVTASASKPVARPAAATVTKEALPPEPVAAAKPAAAKPSTPAPTPPKPVASVPKPDPAPATQPAASGTGFAVQVGAFGNATEATKLRDRLRASGLSAFTETVNSDKGTLTRVRVGPVASRADADALKARVRAAGVDGIVRPHP